MKLANLFSGRCFKLALVVYVLFDLLIGGYNAGLLPLTTLAAAQYAPSGGSNLSRVAGRFVASNYNYPTTNNYVINGNSATGSTSITVQVASIKLPDGRSIYPFNVISPILVGVGSTQEQVTPTAVSNCYTLTTPGNGTCTITGSFTFTHGFGEVIASATGGAAEAVYDAYNAGGGLVAIDNPWAAGLPLGCSGCAASANAVLYALVPYQSVAIEDDRQAAVQYWTATPATASLLAAPTALTAQAACDATHTFCSDATVAGSASWATAVYGCITLVDIMGNESPCSSTANFVPVASKAIDIGAPAAVTSNVVGWKPYLSVANGSYALAYSVPLLLQPTSLQAIPLSSGVCTLTTLETVTPACAIANATYGQAASTTGAGGLFTAGGAQFTGYPLVSNTLAPEIGSASALQHNPNEEAHATYKYVPGSRLGIPGAQSSHIIFPVTAAAQTTIGQVEGTFPVTANFMNYVGRTVEICGLISKTSTVADTIDNIEIWWDAEGSNVTAGTPVLISNIKLTPPTTIIGPFTAALDFQFCQQIVTTVASTSATGGTLTPGQGWLTVSQVSAGANGQAASSSLVAGVGSLNLALPAHFSVELVHTTGTDGAGSTLLDASMRVIN